MADIDPTDWRQVGRVADEMKPAPPAEPETREGERPYERAIREWLEAAPTISREEFIYQRGHAAGEYVGSLLHQDCPTTNDLRAENARLRDENYSDLLDQMDEAWGRAPEIGRIELNAFLESRRVHTPTTRLRIKLAAAERRAEEFRRYGWDLQRRLCDRMCSTPDESSEFYGCPTSHHPDCRHEQTRAALALPRGEGEGS